MVIGLFLLPTQCAGPQVARREAPLQGYTSQFSKFYMQFSTNIPVDQQSVLLEQFMGSVSQFFELLAEGSSQSMQWPAQLEYHPATLGLLKALGLLDRHPGARGAVLALLDRIHDHYLERGTNLRFYAVADQAIAALNPTRLSAEQAAVVAANRAYAMELFQGVSYNHGGIAPNGTLTREARAIGHQGGINCIHYCNIFINLSMGIPDHEYVLGSDGTPNGTGVATTLNLMPVYQKAGMRAERVLDDVSIDPSVTPRLVRLLAQYGEEFHVQLYVEPGHEGPIHSFMIYHKEGDYFVTDAFPGQPVLVDMPLASYLSKFDGRYMTLCLSDVPNPQPLSQSKSAGFLHNLETSVSQMK